MPKKQAVKKSAQSPVALIAGGAGFIGSHLVAALLEKKARVVVLDNFHTGKELHVQEFLKNPKFALFNVDINQGLPEEIESVDYVFHLAGVEEYLYSKNFLNLDSLLTNSYGTKNLLDLAQKSQAKFMLASSVDVYQGRMSQVDLVSYFGDTTEDQTKFSLVEAKRFAEALVWEYYKKHDLDARIVRLPEIFGPKMGLDSSGVLGRFLKDMIEGRDITIFGDGYEKEFYLYVTDAISGLLKALFSDDTKGKIYSLIGADSISTLEVAFLLKGLADREMTIQFRPGKTSVRPKLLPPDVLNLRDLSWKARTNFKQGVLKTLEWFGYASNEHGFKPGKLIAERDERKGKQLFTLQGLGFSPEEQEPVSQVASPLEKKTEKVATIGFSPQNVVNTVSGNQIQPVTHAKRIAFPSADKTGGVKEKVSGIASKLYSKAFLIILALLFGGLTTFLIIPGIRFYTNINRGINNLRQLPDAVYRFDSSLVSERAKSSYNSLYKAKKSLNSLKWVFTVSGKSEEFYTADKLISSLAHFSKAAFSLTDAVAPFEDLWEIIRPDSSKILSMDVFDKASSSLAVAKKQLSLAEAEFKYINKNYVPGSFSNDVEQYGEFISLGLGEIDLVSSLVNDLPGILGKGKEKKYIVWFQNSNELRATGGFIGSYGILKFKDGKLMDLVIDDIYNPDGQLDTRNITVAPPAQVADYLAEDRLYLRNSNWDPDFPKSAEIFKDLYFRVTGEEIDGVFALDLDFTRGLLKALGPVFLTAYNEEITSENLYERTQFHSEFNYENGSEQKKSFLTVLGSKLLEKLFSLEQDRLPVLLKELSSALDSRHLMIYIPDLPISAYVKSRNWDGSLVSADANYLYVVNSNLGGNKADYYVKPKMHFEVESLTRDGLLRGVLRLEYEHTGKDDAWPGGIYKNYVRVLTSLGSKLTSAKTVLNDGEEVDVFSGVAIYNTSGNNTFGYGIEVSPQNKMALILGFDLPERFSVTKDYQEFDLYWQKQPGTSNVEIDFVLTPPFGLSIIDTSSNLEEMYKMVKFNGLLNSDEHFYIKFN